MKNNGQDHDEDNSKTDITITSTPLATWLEIDSDPIPITLNLDHIIAYRPANDYQTSIWFVGQSAMDGGFLVDVEYDDLTEAIKEALQQRSMQRYMMDNGEPPDAEGVEQGYEELNSIAQRRYD